MKTKRKSIVSGLFVIIASFLMLTGCDKEKTVTPSGGNIDAAVGTFKGTLKVFPPTGNPVDYFDATVTVSKAGDSRLTVTPKSGEAYSVITPKTFNVETQSTAGLAVMAVAGSIEGSFVYKLDIKNLQVTTEKQAASDYIFHFAGTKQ